MHNHMATECPQEQSPEDTRLQGLKDFYDKRFEKDAYDLTAISENESRLIRLLVDAALTWRAGTGDENRLFTLIDFGCGDGRLHAIYEGIAFGHWANIQFIPGKEQLATIWLIGGGSNSRVFGQLFADVTGLPVKVPRHKEVTARGGALLALVGLGLFASYEDACREPELEATYVPNDELRSYYQEKFRVFNALFSAQSESWAALHALERSVTKEERKR